ncbi:MAG: hypothetical protein IJ963_05440 [Phascolarctobacterium sp.]|nr:hypothetical protein [Phascolarctobacterium sp.]MBR6636840.1 hypothetical protein [Phascolarctobacterium sp.]
MAGLVTWTEIKSGVVTLYELQKMVALLDMKSDTEAHYAKASQQDEGKVNKW